MFTTSLFFLAVSFQHATYHLGSTYNQNPKIYIDLKCIELIDPLLHGFNIHLPRTLVKEHLDPNKFPIVYASAIPLRNDLPAIRKILYPDDMHDTVVTISDLKASSWYYICVEFENMHRRQRHGNTSTTCELVRTLDTYGKPSESFVADVAISSVVGDHTMDFALQINVDFPLHIDVYLEQGPSLTQRYYLSSPKSLSISFHDLTPGFNYGRLCVQQTPMGTTYTAMGRTISLRKEHCFLGDLKTATAKDHQKIPKTASYLRTYRDVDSGDKNGANFNTPTISYVISVVTMLCSLKLLFGT